MHVLADAGYRVSICCFYEFDSLMVEQMECARAKVTLQNQRWGDGLLTLLTYVFGFLRKGKPDVVHVQYMAPGCIAVLAARLAEGKTVFATVHQPGRTYGGKSKDLLRVWHFFSGRKINFHPNNF